MSRRLASLSLIAYNFSIGSNGDVAACSFHPTRLNQLLLWRVYCFNQRHLPGFIRKLNESPRSTAGDTSLQWTRSRRKTSASSSQLLSQLTKEGSPQLTDSSSNPLIHAKLLVILSIIPSATSSNLGFSRRRQVFSTQHHCLMHDCGLGGQQL